MTYSEKLRDPRWQKKHLEVFQRDGWKCRECNSDDRTLHVDHLYYLRGRNPWEYELTALWTLCERCHEIKTHNRKFDKPPTRTKWLVFHGLPVDEFSDCFIEPPDGDCEFEDAERALLHIHPTIKDGRGLRQCLIYMGDFGFRFFLFKVDSGGDTFIVTYPGDEAMALAAVSVEDYDNGWRPLT